MQRSQVPWEVIEKAKDSILPSEFSVSALKRRKQNLKKKSMLTKNRNIFALDHVCAVCVGVCVYG